MSSEIDKKRYDYGKPTITDEGRFIGFNWRNTYHYIRKVDVKEVIMQGNPHENLSDIRLLTYDGRSFEFSYSVHDSGVNAFAQVINFLKDNG